MSKNTGIRIEAIREISDSGEKGYRITKIEALNRSELPELYLDSSGATVALGTGGYLYLRAGGKAVCVNGWDGIRRTFYSTTDVRIILKHTQAAGQHLANVNAYLRKEREAWQGGVTFVDGVETGEKAPAPSSQENTPPVKKIAETLCGEHIYWDGGRLYCSDSKGKFRKM